jgi:hypothetical protein
VPYSRVAAIPAKRLPAQRKRMFMAYLRVGVNDVLVVRAALDVPATL